MSWGSFIWSSNFLNLAKDGEDFVCNTVTIGDKSGYSALDGLFQQIVDKQSCLDNFDKVFSTLDLNGDNLLSRCEDAAFQEFMGSSPAYAKKFSGNFTKAYGKSLVCGQFKF